MIAASDLAHALGKPEQHGQRWRCLCPAHADSTPSLDIDTTPDGRLLFVCRAGCDNGDIIAALTSRGLWPLQGAAPRRTDRPRHREWGDPTEVYTYRDRDGHVVGLVCRWDVTINGRLDKHILPYTRADDGRWVAKGIQAPIPLYGLADVLARPEAQVVVVEGERKRDDLASVLGPDFAIVSWAHGAKSPQKTDWSPLYGRRVVLWPDNDDPGDQAMSKIAGILAGQSGVAAPDKPQVGATQLKYLRRDPVKPKGWDASDAIRTDGWGATEILKWATERAEVWTPDTPAKKIGPLGSGPKSREESNGEGVRTSNGNQATRPQPANQSPSASVLAFKPRTDISADDESGFSDDRLALAFSQQHSEGLRYVPSWNKWFEWNGQRWQEELTLLPFEYARQITRTAAASAQLTAPQSVKSIRSAKTVASIVSLARSDRRHAVTPEIWDTDTWLLNTPSGTVDLRTSELRAAAQSDHITKITAVHPDHTCKTPVWDSFLVWVTGNDASLQDFLKRICGYSLTGDTREHALFFLYGTGGNGKGTFINTIMGCMGDYGRTAAIETFTESKNERHPTELANLRGSRLVTAQETEEGRRWAESRIKALTGGDKISARFMRQDFFEFVPQFKLMVAGNHKPGLRAVDEAIRRRFNLIPFAAQITSADRDPNLAAKLRHEWPGILQWMIDGCAEWQEQGLAPPECVTRATAEYLETEDAIASWIDDRCEIAPSAWTSVAELYASWKKWAEASGEFAGSVKRFSQNMQARGFDQLRGGHSSAKGFKGIRVAISYQDEPNLSYDT